MHRLSLVLVVGDKSRHLIKRVTVRYLLTPKLAVRPALRESGANSTEEVEKSGHEFSESRFYGRSFAALVELTRRALRTHSKRSRKRHYRNHKQVS